MNRKIYNKLIDWKKNGMIKPLMLIGARQVGKTYILKKFCKQEFTNYVYINLLDHAEIVKLYEEPISLEDKYIRMCAYLNINVDLENTVIFIDEIQESEDMISALKWFCEDERPFKIVCAGSLLGVKLNRFKKSFPVGKIEMYNMYPMDFEEFLFLQENGVYLINLIKDCFSNNKKMDDVTHNKLIDLYRKYLCTGGMPEMLFDFKNKNFNILDINKKILDDIVIAYLNDMNKYVKNKFEATRNEQVYNSVASQIGNKANKFQYSKIDKNSRSREYESSLDWLISSKLIHKCCKLKSINIPPKAYKDDEYFKLYLNDNGLLNSQLKINLNDIYLNRDFLFKGEIAENYVANQLIYNDVDIYYWTNVSNSEIDFIIYNEDGLIPIEVKANDKTQSKSLNEYINKYQPKYVIKVSTKNFGFVNNIKSVPLYATFLIK